MTRPRLAHDSSMTHLDHVSPGERRPHVKHRAPRDAAAAPLALALALARRRASAHDRDRARAVVGRRAERRALRAQPPAAAA